MIYIEIPEGMEYRQLPSEDKEGKPSMEDRFVSIAGDKPDISIQKIVHRFYHEYHGKENNEGLINEIMLYKTKPSLTLNTKPLLEYKAQNTACSPTTHSRKIYSQAPATENKSNTLPTGRWIDHTLLSDKSHKKAKEKEEAQKYNRRKWGDSPNAN